MAACYNPVKFHRAMKTTSSGDKPLIAAIPAAISLVMLLVSVFIAVQLSFGLIGASYSHWIIGASPAVNDPSPVMVMANRVAALFPAMISMGIARAIIMIITFAVGAVLLNTTTSYRISEIGGYGAAFTFLALALIVMFFSAARVAWDPGVSVLDYVAQIVLSGLMLVFATMLVQLLRRPRLLIWFAVPFALLLVVHILFMLMASRALQLGVQFLANIVFLGVIAVFAGALAYTYKLLVHLQEK
jgi:hypothetical protein